jgi:hypothetical protein
VEYCADACDLVIFDKPNASDLQFFSKVQFFGFPRKSVRTLPTGWFAKVYRILV